MFFLTILYIAVHKLLQCVYLLLSCFILFTNLYYQDRINSDYNLKCFKTILIHIDMDVSEERAPHLNLREVGLS
jgi:hypothetical protein